MLRFLPAACILLVAGVAHANCTTATTLGIKDAAGTTLSAAAEPDSNTNCVPNTYITDGGGAQNRVAVKAASTAAATTDPALVVRTPPDNVTGIVDSAGVNKATVKAASTAPVATDPALVVALSPNGQGCGGASIVNTHWTPISITAATNTQIITGTASLQTYICAINILTGAANNVALVEGTGTTCATGTAGMAGGTTAANGWNFTAGNGLTIGDGRGPIIRTATAADNVCIFPSSVGPLAGTIVWAQF